MVIFLFLRTAAGTVIPSVAVPLSLVGTFGVIYLLGFSLNNLTLMALTISTGFVVDDAIVMIENISRYIEEGVPPLKAALQGSEQIGFTIMSLTVSLIAVLIPLLFMGDVVGRLFREFAVTLSVTILISMAVSLTLTPMMCAKLLRHKPESEQSRFYRTSQHAFDQVIEFYDRTLTWVLRHRRETLVVAAGTLVLTVVLYIAIPKGFFPVQDTGVILGISEAPQTVSFAAMAERQQALAQVILKDPAVESLSSFIGIDGTNTTVNSGRIQINLVPLGKRKASSSEIIRRLQPRLAEVAGITLFMQPVQELTVEDRVSRTQFQYSLEDPDVRELASWAPRFVARLRTLPELRDVASDQQTEGLEAHLTLDRTTASRLGITPQMLDDALYDSFGQRQVSTIFTELNQYRVVLETQPDFQKQPEDLEQVRLMSDSGGAVPLGSFTSVQVSNVPLAVNHQGQFPVVTVSFNLAPNASLGEAVRAVDKAALDVGLPQSIQTGLPGHGPGLPGLDGEHAVPAPRRDHHRLHPPRRALRELHPSGDDPLHPALGGDRGAAVPDALPHGLLRHRPHRHHPPHRHRREERHHDDRLRSRRPAPGGQARPRRHLPGRAPAVPADPDDDDGGPARRRSPGRGFGDRLGAPASPRHRHRRRPDLQPDADPVHDAGDLPRL